MKPAIPEPTAATPGWVLYDGECSLCTRAARCCRGLLRRHGFELAALQTDWVGARLGLDQSRRPDELMVLLPDGRTLGGADGILQIARRVWWAWPLFALGRVPGMRILFRAMYQQIAARRTCHGHACKLPGPRLPRRHSLPFFEMP